jgi:hypothetical protein
LIGRRPTTPALLEDNKWLVAAVPPAMDPLSEDRG